VLSESNGKQRRRNWDELRNSRNVRAAPHDSSMKNPTQLSLPLLPADVNNLGKFQEDSASGRTIPIVGDLDLIVRELGHLSVRLARAANYSRRLDQRWTTSGKIIRSDTVSRSSDGSLMLILRSLLANHYSNDLASLRNLS